MRKLMVCAALLTLCDGAYAKDAEGIWRDPETGLMWMRCSIGQKWTGKTCTGKALEFEWQKALDFADSLNRGGGFAGYSDWRVPVIEELFTIRKCSNGFKREIGYKTTVEGKVAIKEEIERIGLPNGQSVPEMCDDGSSRPTINTVIFPNTPSDWYWSSSPVANDRYAAWLVGFGHGDGSYLNKYTRYSVRLVHSSQ